MINCGIYGTTSLPGITGNSRNSPAVHSRITPASTNLPGHRRSKRRCRACQRAFLYPRVLCPFCHGSDIEWIQASGRGKLYSFEIAYQTISKVFKIKGGCVHVCGSGYPLCRVSGRGRRCAHPSAHIHTRHTYTLVHTHVHCTPYIYVHIHIPVPSSLTPAGPPESNTWTRSFPNSATYTCPAPSTAMP